MPQPLRRRLLILPTNGISYLLRDEFTTDRAAGAVSGTSAEPGPGERSVIADNGSYISVAGGSLKFAAAGGYGNAAIRLGSVARVAGTKIVYSLTQGASGVFEFGLVSTSNNTRPVHHCMEVSSGTLLRAWYGGGSNLNTVYTLIAGMEYKYAVALRASGYAGFVLDGVWLLLWVDSASSVSPMYLIGSNNNATSDLNWYKVIGSPLLWLPTPLVSDGFGSAFGTSDGLGHAETTGIGSGGGNVAWTQQIGTWGISSGKAVATALSGGEAVATVPLSTANPFIGIDLTRSAGNVGGVARWTDANNHLRFYHDGTNCVLQQVVSGTPTTLITAAATYSANARVWLWLNGTTARLYYNNALVGSTSSINAALTAANTGIRTTDTGNTMDNFAAYAVGVEGQYSNLDQY